METTTEKTPSTIRELTFRMLFRAKGEAGFLYRVSGIDTGSRSGGEIYFTREHDGAKVIMTGDRFAEMVKQNNLIYISKN